MRGDCPVADRADADPTDPRLAGQGHAPDTAKNWAPAMNKIGSLGILILLVVGLGLNLANVISLIGTRGFLALLLFIFGSLLIGFAVGGPRSWRPQCDGVGHCPAQCVGCHSHHTSKLCRNNGSPICAGGGDPAPVDINIYPTLFRRSRRSRGRAGGTSGVTLF